jgi:hypothetical protein
MAEQSGLDVLDLEWLLEQRVVHQVNLPNRKIIRRPPVSMHPAEFFRSEDVFRKR